MKKWLPNSNNEPLEDLGNKDKEEENFKNSFINVFDKKDNVEDFKLGTNIFFYKNDSYDDSRNNNILETEDKNFFHLSEGNMFERNNKYVSTDTFDIISKYKDIIKDIQKDDNNESMFKISNFNTSFICIKDINKTKTAETPNNNDKIKINEIDDKNNINPYLAEKIWIRGPYKKKNENPEKKIIVQAKTDDKCFPFTSGKGLLKLFDYKNEEKEEEDDNNENEENLKVEYKDTKFKTRQYFKDPCGKIRKVKKQRKFKSDDLRKRIKALFHKSLKDITNEKLKDAGAEELFSFLPHSFLVNVTKTFNSKYMNSTFAELIATDFTQGQLKCINQSSDKKNFFKNEKVLKYLEDNPDISKNSGFDIIKNMKYKDLLRSYFLSNEFENTIMMLKNKNENDEYIHEYIMMSKNYIDYFLSPE
jgi:hypothetical protein